MNAVIVILGVVAAIAWTCVLWDVVSETRWGIRVYMWRSNRRARHNHH